MGVKKGILGVIFIAQVAMGALPEWVGHPLSDDENSLYGVGEGGSLNQARDDALSTLISKLNVTISSTLSNTQTQSTLNDAISYQKKVTHTTNSEVKKIAINTYEIIYSAREDDRTYVLVRVDKKKFIEEKKGEVAALEQAMAQKFESVKNRDIIDRFARLKEIQMLCDQATTRVEILSSLEGYVKAPHLKVYEMYAQEMDKTVGQIVAYVQSDEKSRLFAAALKDELVMNKIKTSQMYSGKKDEIFISVETQPMVKQLYGRYMAKVKVTMLLKKGDNVLFSSTIDAFGNSAIDEQNALIAAASDYRAKVKQKGALYFLGFEATVQ